MTNPEAILQLARLAGRAELTAALHVEGGDLPLSLDADQLARLETLVDARTEAIAHGLLEEAMASDDVQDSASALAFLEDRLVFLGALLTARQRDRLRAELRAATRAWN